MLNLILLSLLCLSRSLAVIHELSSANFTEFTRLHPRTFLYFYSPKCTYCRVLHPDFAQLPQHLTQDDLRFARINAINNHRLAEEYNVSGYPTILMWDHGWPVRYSQQRDLEQMVAWLRQYLRDRLEPVGAGDGLRGVLVAGGTEADRRVVNQAVFEVQGLRAYSLSSQGPLKIVYQGRKGNIEYSGTLSPSPLRTWVLQHAQNPITPLTSTQTINSLLFSSPKPTLLFILTPHDHSNHTLSQQLTQLCEQYSQQVHCGQLLPHYPAYEGAHGYFQVQDKNKTLVGLVREKMAVGYRMEQGDLGYEGVREFVEAALAGRIRRIVDNVAPEEVRFEVVELLEPEGVQTKIKEKTDVFINFYSSKDETSLVFSRPYQSFASICSQQPQTSSLVIAAVDCHIHGPLCKQHGITYYPTLKYFKSGLAIEYLKTAKLPEIPELVRFVQGKLNASCQQIKDMEEVQKMEKPVLVVQGTQKQAQAIAAMIDFVPVLHLPSASPQPQLTLFLDSDPIRFTSSLASLFSWVHSQLPSLPNLLQQTQDPRIAAASRAKLPIIVLLDCEPHRSPHLRLKLALICNHLNQTCAYADSRNSVYDSFVKWVPIEKGKVSQLLYSDVKWDRRYGYQGEVGELTESKLTSFVKEVRSGKMPYLGYVQPVTQQQL